MRPHICTVHRNVQWDISDQTDLFLVCILLQTVPLLIKLVLTELPKTDLISKLLLPELHSSLLAETDVLLPQLPFLIVIFKLECHIKAVICEPVCILSAEGTIR